MEMMTFDEMIKVGTGFLVGGSLAATLLFIHMIRDLKAELKNEIMCFWMVAGITPIVLASYVMGFVNSIMVNSFVIASITFIQLLMARRTRALRRLKSQQHPAINKI